MDKQILANFDDQGIFVYQAFKPSIAKEAVRLGTFGKGFNLERMTWIKSSFGWMLYRSGYATKHRQERILKIKLTHPGFQTILSQAIPTSYDSNLFTSQDEWRGILQNSEVRYQWDPDRDLSLKKLEHRALQLGIRGSVVKKYVNSWIISIEDVTELAHSIKTGVNNQLKELPVVPPEYIYQVSPDIQKILGIL